MTESRSTDLCVYGGTLAGVAAAVRAAREGLRVTLVNHTHHLGGMITNGIVQWDALSAARRCPIFDELLTLIENHYRDKSGEGSRDHVNSQYRIDRFPVGSVEPHVGERLITKLVADEPNITVIPGYGVGRARRRYRRLDSVRFDPMAGEPRGAGEPIAIAARHYIDASYEGDLVPASGVPFRVGREGHDETGEPHAGRIYTRQRPGQVQGPDPATAEAWGLRPFHMTLDLVDPHSPRTGDHCVQAYNLRPCLTRDPDNGVPLTAPPPGYDRERYLRYARKTLALHGPKHAINHKTTWNSAILPGENWGYPLGDWAARHKNDRLHRRFALGLMWFLQNDESVDADRQEKFRGEMLCRDEWPDNDHLPYEMYVREGLRLVGRYQLSEHDLTPQPHNDTPRSFADAIAFTDWFMDSHSCDHDNTYGDPVSDDYPWEGKLVLSQQLRPGQIPYRCLLPRGLDNLVVPVAMGCTHIAHGAVRLEPCWTHLGEVAGFAAAMAHHDGTTAGELDGEHVAAHIAQRGVQVTYPKPAHASNPPS